MANTPPYDPTSTAGAYARVMPPGLDRNSGLMQWPDDAIQVEEILSPERSFGVGPYRHGDNASILRDTQGQHHYMNKSPAAVRKELMSILSQRNANLSDATALDPSRYNNQFAIDAANYPFLSDPSYESPKFKWGGGVYEAASGSPGYGADAFTEWDKYVTEAIGEDLTPMGFHEWVAQGRPPSEGDDDWPWWAKLGTGYGAYRVASEIGKWGYNRSQKVRETQERGTIPPEGGDLKNPKEAAWRHVTRALSGFPPKQYPRGTELKPAEAPPPTPSDMTPEGTRPVDDLVANLEEKMARNPLADPVVADSSVPGGETPETYTGELVRSPDDLVLNKDRMIKHYKTKYFADENLHPSYLKARETMESALIKQLKVPLELSWNPDAFASANRNLKLPQVPDIGPEWTGPANQLDFSWTDSADFDNKVAALMEDHRKVLTTMDANNIADTSVQAKHPELNVGREGKGYFGGKRGVAKLSRYMNDVRYLKENASYPAGHAHEGQIMGSTSEF